MDLNAAVHVLLTTGSHTRAAPFDGVACADLDTVAAEQPCLSPSVWHALMEHMEALTLTSKNARRVATALAHTIHALVRVLCARPSPSAASTASPPPAVPTGVADVLWPLAALLHTLADKLSQQTDAFTPAGADMPPTLVAQAGAYEYGVPVAGSSTESGETYAAAMRIITRLDEAAAIAGAACRLYVLTPASTLRSLRAGGACPVLALTEACVAALALAARSQSHIKKASTILLSDERTAPYKMDGDPHTTLLEVLLAAKLQCTQSSEEVATQAQRDRVQYLISIIMEHALFTPAFTSSLPMACSQALLLAQHGALYVLHQSQPAAGVAVKSITASAMDDAREEVLNASAWPRAGATEALKCASFISNEKRLFDVLLASVSREDGTRSLLHTLPLLCAMYLSAEARAERAGPTEPGPATAPAPSHATPAGSASRVHDIATAAMSRMHRHARFTVLMELLCVAMGYTPATTTASDADAPVATISVDTTVSSPFFVRLSLGADMLRCVASVLTHVCDNSVYNIHEDTAPHVQYCTLKLCADAVLQTAERLCREVHSEDEARHCADATACVCVALLNLHTALLPDLHRALYVCAVMGARGRDAGAAIRLLATTCVGVFSRLRRLGAYTHAAGAAWGLLSSKAAPAADATLAGQYMHECMTGTDHLGAYATALRVLPPGQVQSHGDALCARLLSFIDTCEPDTADEAGVARAGQKRRRAAASSSAATDLPQLAALRTWVCLCSTYMRSLWLSPAAALAVLRRAVHVAMTAGARLVALAASSSEQTEDTAIRYVYTCCGSMILAACMDATVAAAPFQDVRALVDIHTSSEKQAMSPLWPMSVCVSVLPDTDVPSVVAVDRKEWLRILAATAAHHDSPAGIEHVCMLASAYARLLSACFSGADMPHKLEKHLRKLRDIARVQAPVVDDVNDPELLEKPDLLVPLLTSVSDELRKVLESFASGLGSPGKKRARSHVNTLPPAVSDAFAAPSDADDDAPRWDVCARVCAAVAGHVSTCPSDADKLLALQRDIDAQLSRIPEGLWLMLRSALCSPACAQASVRVACDCMCAYALASVHTHTCSERLTHTLAAACSALDAETAALVPAQLMTIACTCASHAASSVPSPLLAAIVRMVSLASNPVTATDDALTLHATAPVCASVCDALATLPDACAALKGALTRVHAHSDTLESSSMVAVSALRAVSACRCKDTHTGKATDGIAHTIRKHIRATVKQAADPAEAVTSWGASQLHVLSCLAHACVLTDARVQPQVLQHVLDHSQLYAYLLVCAQASVGTVYAPRVLRCIECIAPYLRVRGIASAAGVGTQHAHTRAVLSGIASYVYSHTMVAAAADDESDASSLPLASCSLPQLRDCMRTYTQDLAHMLCGDALSHTLTTTEAEEVLATLRVLVSHSRAWDVPSHVMRDISHIACAHARWAPLAASSLRLLGACVKFHRDALMDVLPAIVHAVTTCMCDLITAAPTADVSVRADALNSCVQGVAAMCRPVRYNVVAAVTAVVVHIVRLLSRSDKHAHTLAVRASLDVIKPALFEWLDLCTQREMQEIHTRVATGTARGMLKELHTAYENEFKYTGKA